MNPCNPTRQTTRSILLGGIGGDSHSVGLTILRQALIMHGYLVHYLGIQNCLEDFCREASSHDIVMISCMDGHAQYYLREFPKIIKRDRHHRPLWYLGGNLTIGEAIGYERCFMEMGFDRVFVKFVEISTVLTVLEIDLSRVEPVGIIESTDKQLQLRGGDVSSVVRDDAVELADLIRERREVINQWPTGYITANLDANAEFLSRQPSFADIQMHVNEGLSPMITQPRCGVPWPSQQLRYFRLLKCAGAQALSYQVDSLTRNGDYDTVEAAIRESGPAEPPVLNGFPVVNHGVDCLRQIIRDIQVPLQTRHSTRDPRLLAEISYAGGVTAFEGGAITYNIPYYKDYPLDQAINIWQYVDRLTGLYYEKYGIVLDREFFGTLTATLIPPCLAIVVDIIEAILAVQQGVRCVSLGYAEQGNRIQDVAAIRVLREMSHDIIRNMGYKHVQVNIIYHQYMAAFPDRKHAQDLIYNSAITAALSGATRMLTKTPVEAYKIPEIGDNVAGLVLAKRGIMAAASQAIDEARVMEECAFIRREVRAILESTILSGSGSIAKGVIKAFQSGLLDIPFSPSVHCKGEVVTARDLDGAVRFLSTGQLQLDSELQDYHRHKMQERRNAEGLLSEKFNYVLVERDVLQIARGEYQRWPLSQ